MQTFTLRMQAGEVIFHCTGCRQDFVLDANRPFVAQLRALSYDHHCTRTVAADDESIDLFAYTRSSRPNTR